MIFTSLDALVPFARRRAMRGFFDGRMNDRSTALMQSCAHRYHRPLRGQAAMVIFTRDIGHHTGGWWKNPDYERCLHLSLSQVDPETGAPAPREAAFFREIAEAFFGHDARKTWLEGPYTPEGRSSDVWHYRLFCDEGWEPIIPRGEVYSKEFTEAGWRSFSEVHAVAPEDVEAPFLMEGL